MSETENQINMLLDPLTFPSTVQSSENLLKEMFVLIQKYCTEEKEDEFWENCKNLNCDEVNSLLDKLVLILTGEESVLNAARILSGRIPQSNTDLINGAYSATSTQDAVKFTATNAEKILAAIEEAKIPASETIKKTLYTKVESFQHFIDLIIKLFTQDIPRLFKEQNLFSQKDLDFIELMRKIEAIYEKTEEYMTSK